jgi:hypothetical protein
MKKDPPLELSRRDPCSNTGELGRCEETSGGDPSGDGEPEGASGGVGTLLDGGLPSIEGERTRLVPLLSSIVREQGARKVNPKQKGKEECEMIISAR